MAEIGLLELALQGGTPAVLGVVLWVVARWYRQERDDHLAARDRFEALASGCAEADRTAAEALDSLTEAIEQWTVEEE